MICRLHMVWMSCRAALPWLGSLCPSGLRHRDAPAEDDGDQDSRDRPPAAGLSNGLGRGARPDRAAARRSSSGVARADVVPASGG